MNIHTKFFSVLRMKDYFQDVSKDTNDDNGIGIVVMDVFHRGFRRIIVPIDVWRKYGRDIIYGHHFEIYQHMLCMSIHQDSSGVTELTDYTKHVFITPDVTFAHLRLYLQAVMRNLNDRVTKDDDIIVAFLHT
jgi:hypothetical protein